MKIYVEGLDNFNPWSGAIETYEAIEEAGKLEDLEFLLEDIYPDGLTETELNDLVWFDDEWLFASLGMETEDEEDEDEDEGY